MERIKDGKRGVRGVLARLDSDRAFGREMQGVSRHLARLDLGAHLPAA